MFSSKLHQIEQKRASAPPLPTGAAPWTSSRQFKISTSNDKSFANSWDRHFSRIGSRLKASVLKTAALASGPTQTISLGTGRPAAEFYPWASLSMDIPRRASTEDDIHLTCAAGEATYGLNVALNYGYSAGSPQLLRFITERCAITTGTTSAIDHTLQILCDARDYILVEEYTYPGFIDGAKALGVKLVGVKMDEDGLLPGDLDHILRNWDNTIDKRPSLLYMIPTGHNPIGITQSTERRKAIYAVAELHDLLIIEDDPYMFLQLQRAGTHFPPIETSQTPEDHYLAILPTSYLSLDISGRVIRLDSTSKILAPGLRCGWITACSQIMAKFLARTDVSTVSTNGPTQIMLYKLLDESWGHDGFVRWLMELSGNYTRRVSIFSRACERYLPRDVCSWKIPEDGMFLWIRLEPKWSKANSPAIDDASCRHSFDVEGAIYEDARRRGVTISRDSWFQVHSEAEPRTIHFRLTFAAASESDLDLAVQRFADAIAAILKHASSEFSSTLQGPDSDNAGLNSENPWVSQASKGPPSTYRAADCDSSMSGGCAPA
ncbi:PLP-dependent transferase [Setomelanomma holmii]|uniref:PLP-dependent transferase n=1 Tax=Setomelanomma holmii TaxID=210430 RepID=A0A9P4H1U8_9PLEO|nr:PLP-dependent transferase [Setomelanomma holmii]